MAPDFGAFRKPKWCPRNLKPPGKEWNFSEAQWIQDSKGQQRKEYYTEKKAKSKPVNTHLRFTKERKQEHKKKAEKMATKACPHLKVGRGSWTWTTLPSNTHYSEILGKKRQNKNVRKKGKKWSTSWFGITGTVECGPYGLKHKLANNSHSQIWDF